MATNARMENVFWIVKRVSKIATGCAPIQRPLNNIAANVDMNVLLENYVSIVCVPILVPRVPYFVEDNAFPDRACLCVLTGNAFVLTAVAPMSKMIRRIVPTATLYVLQRMPWEFAKTVVVK